MKIVNRRNAVLGWMTWRVGKGMAKRKARGAMPGKPEKSKTKKPAILAGVLAAVGITALLKRRQGGGAGSEGGGAGSEESSG